MYVVNKKDVSFIWIVMYKKCFLYLCICYLHTLFSICMNKYSILKICECAILMDVYSVACPIRPSVNKLVSTVRSPDSQI